MNPIAEFINSGLHCPCCNNELTLFLQIEASVCLKGGPAQLDIRDYLQDYSKHEIVRPHRQIVFTPAYRTYTTSNAPSSEIFNEKDGIELSIHHKQASLAPQTHKIQQLLKNRRLYFFAICNPNAIKSSNWDYQISAYKACYYKTSPYVRLDPGQITIEDDDCSSHIKFETVSFQNMSNDVEKTYIMSLNYYQNQTQFYYFTATKEQLKDAKYRPTPLSKTLPLLNKRPDFSKENREKLFAKFDSWVILS